MFELMERMGPLGLPLLACSVASLAVIVERAMVLLRARSPRRRAVDALVAVVAEGGTDRMIDAAAALPSPFREGAMLLADHAARPRALREDVATVWLDGLRRRLTRNLAFLQLMAAISPLLGLLGTVIGMIVAFRDIAGFDRPVNPALVANGLWQAMLTTAFGLSIALPALFFAHLYRMRATRIADLVEADLNRLNLAIEMAAADAPPTGKDPS